VVRCGIETVSRSGEHRHGRAQSEGRRATTASLLVVWPSSERESYRSKARRVDQGRSSRASTGPAARALGCPTAAHVCYALGHCYQEPQLSHPTRRLVGVRATCGEPCTTSCACCAVLVPYTDKGARAPLLSPRASTSTVSHRNHVALRAGQPEHRRRARRTVCAHHDGRPRTCASRCRTHLRPCATHI